MRNNLNVSTAAIAPVAAFAPIAIADTRTFRDKVKAVTDSEVAAMIADIEASFARRDTFEGANAIGSTSYTVNRAAMLNAKHKVARFFVALNVSASSVIERKVSANKMFNAKALKKIVELARFAFDGDRKIEKVMQAFIVCALAFSVKSDGAIANRFNKSFLSGLNFDQIVTDSELAEYIADYQHKFMSGGKDTQSSQARNVIDVLGLGAIVSCENRARGGIEIAADHAFFADFTAAFCK